MPFKYSCTDHPIWSADHLSDVMDHVDSLHPDEDYMTLRDDKRVTCIVIRQNEAQGNPNLHTFMCRSCNTTITKREGHPSIASGKCESCMGNDVLEAHGG